MFQTNFVAEINTLILYPIIFFRKSWHLWEYGQKYGTARARQAADSTIIRRINSDLHAGRLRYEPDRQTHAHNI